MCLFQQLKDYVGAEGKGGGANQGESTVLLHCSHTNLKAQFMELRFDRHVRKSVNLFIARALKIT